MIEWVNSNKMPKGLKLTWVKEKWGQFPHSGKTRWMLRADSSLYPTSPPWLIEERIALWFCAEEAANSLYSFVSPAAPRKTERTKISSQRATPTGLWFPKGQGWCASEVRTHCWPLALWTHPRHRFPFVFCIPSSIELVTVAGWITQVRRDLQVDHLQF